MVASFQELKFILLSKWCKIPVTFFKGGTNKLTPVPLMICQLFFRNSFEGTCKLRPWLCHALVLWPFMAAIGATSTTCDHLGGGTLMANRDDARAHGRATGVEFGKREDGNDRKSAWKLRTVGV